MMYMLFVFRENVCFKNTLMPPPPTTGNNCAVQTPKKLCKKTVSYRCTGCIFSSSTNIRTLIKMIGFFFGREGMNAA